MKNLTVVTVFLSVLYLSSAAVADQSDDLKTINQYNKVEKNGDWTTSTNIVLDLSETWWNWTYKNYNVYDLPRNDIDGISFQVRSSVGYSWKTSLYWGPTEQGVHESRTYFCGKNYCYYTCTEQSAFNDFDFFSGYGYQKVEYTYSGGTQNYSRRYFIQ